MPAPKQLFRQSKDRCKVLAAITQSDAFEEAVVYAMAEFAATHPSDERLRGVHHFLDILTHLHTEDEERESPFAIPRLTPPEELVPKEGDK